MPYSGLSDRQDAQRTSDSGNDEKSLGKTELVYRWIRQQIADFTFGPGHKLILAQIAAEMNTSVVPVREAIRRLEADGFVTFARNVGARVSEVDRVQYAHAVQATSILEAAATACSAEFMLPEDLDEAEALNDQMKALLDDFDPLSFTELNRMFHETLYRRCPNAHLTTMVEREWDRLGNLRLSIIEFEPGRATQSVADHYQLVGLIRFKASMDEIERAVRKHRDASLESVARARLES